MFRILTRPSPLLRQWSTRGISVATNPLKSAEKSNKKLIAASAITATGVLFYFTNDDFRQGARHTFFTLKRVGVVTVAVTKCFYLYEKALRFKSFDNEEDRRNYMKQTHEKAAVITRCALETNGGVYIKMGQHVSAMTYLLPKEWTDAMIPLQQQCPQSDLEELDEMFINDLGKKIDDMFIEFDPNPIGVASLAQVHIAKLRGTEEKVAVKCQHPSLQEFVPIDVLMTQNVFNMMLKVFPEYPLTWLGDELQSSIYVELDFQNEAKNAIKTLEYFKNFKKQTALRIPEIKESHPRILVMEYIGGKRLDDLAYMDSHNISRGKVSACLSHIFNNMIFTPDVGVHCDPHGGNLAIRSIKPTKENPNNFEIILYDHGLYRQIPEQMRKDYARFWLAMLDHNVEKMELYAEKFAGITHEQFPILALAITGRDFKHAIGGEVASARSEDEIANMKEALVDGGQFIQLMSLLATLPRVVLLILKTNDLTRHLDEDLQNPLGLERTFLILATYCAKTVLKDDLDICNRTKKGLSWIVGEIRAYWNYYKRADQLVWYDFVLSIKNLLPLV